MQGPVGAQGPAGSLSWLSANLAVSVTMTNANQFYDGPTLVLSPGTWLLFGYLTAGRAGTGATAYTARISDGATHYASAQFSQATLNPHVVNLSLVSAPIVVVAGPALTVKLQCAANVASSIIYAAATVNTAGANAAGMRALKLA